MNRIKFTLLAASLTLAMALTLSCSDDKDDSSGVVSCMYSEFSFSRPLNGYSKGGYCRERVKAYFELKGAPMAEVIEECEEDGGEFINGSCPTEHVLKCTYGSNEKLRSDYLYGNQFKDVDDCDEFSDAL